MNVGILARTYSYSVRRLEEVAAARGHKVRVIRYPECYVEIKQGKPTVRYHRKSLDDLDAVIPHMPSGTASYGTAIVRQFEIMGVYTSAQSTAIMRSHDKLQSAQLLSGAGVDMPKTVFSRKTTEVDELIDRLGAPMIIKLTIGTQGNGVVLAETRKAAKSMIQAFYANDANFLLQEYIEEAAGADVRALVVGNKVVASMKRKSLDGDFRSNLHQGGRGQIVKLNPEERRMALKAACALGLDICGVDMIRSRRGPLVLEVNAAPGLEGIEAVTGCDVATAIIDYVEQKAQRTRRKDRIGA